MGRPRQLLSEERTGTKKNNNSSDLSRRRENRRRKRSKYSKESRVFLENNLRSGTQKNVGIYIYMYTSL